MFVSWRGPEKGSNLENATVVQTLDGGLVNSAIGALTWEGQN